MEQNWVNCYKNIIEDICSFDGVWQGIYAQIFPVCNQSDEDNEYNVAEFTTYDFLDAVEDSMIIGTVDPGSWRYCECLPFTANCHKDTSTTASTSAGPTKWTPINYMAESFYDNMGAYYWNTYADAGAIDFNWSSLF